MLATVKLYQLDWTGADAARKRARALAPNAEDVLFNSALHLATMGKRKEALAELDKALLAAPTSASNLRTLYVALVYSWSGEDTTRLMFSTSLAAIRGSRNMRKRICGRTIIPTRFAWSDKKPWSAAAVRTR